MSWTPEQFLDLLEERGIMAPDHIDHLREQLAAVEGGVHAVHIARKLVDAGYLNAYFAKTLLEEGYQSRRAVTGHTAAKPTPHASLDDELDLAPLEEDEREEQAALAKGAPIDLKIELTPLHDPDAWPTATESAPLLPAANPQSGYGALKQIEADARLIRRHSGNSTWLLWTLSGAVAVLVLMVAMLLMWR